ncbi:MMPL family transporter [Paenibacillus barcinonensis]|uniref:MMPL family transporter n=1 Tax=Paenibacillus barcinonensis TaxID=198119 RepID=A0A2V4VXT8_PAEBA|nr:MMPL family transporter [Paenibacillus barcinonensis]PYE50189.1 RND superfamily putative drug exporter [Paenibacillus barcinonensis]QKS54888.1 MMPL family transporter [Paenibacillus barcinonensis]
MGYRSLAALISRYPWFIILSWVLVIGMSAVWAWKLPDIVQDHGLKLVQGQAQAVEQIMEQEYNFPPDPVVLLFHKHPDTSMKMFRDWLTESLSAVRTLPAISAVISPLDAHTQGRMLHEDQAYALLHMNAEPRQIGSVLKQLRELLSSDEHTYVPGTVHLTGKAVVQQDVNRLSFRDLERAEIVGVPIALIVLCVAFRGLYAACIAVMMGISAVITAMGVTSLLGYHLELSNFIINVIPMVGMALSIDFALIILSRYREELQRIYKREGQFHLGSNSTLQRELLQQSLRTAGRAVLFSAACVLLGLLGLLWIRLPMFLSVSLGATIVLVLSLLLNVTLLPAILSLNANRIFRSFLLKNSSPHQSAAEAGLEDSFWHRWSAMVMKHPVWMGLAGTTLLLWCVFPVIRMELAVPDASSLPATMESRQAAEQIQRNFGQAGMSVIDIVIGEKAKPLTASHLERAADKLRELKQDPRVTSIHSLWNISGSYMQLTIGVQGEPGSDEMRDWLKQARAADLGAGLEGIPIRYGGEAVHQDEIIQEVFQRLPKVLVFVVVSNYLVLLLAFRSLLIPLKAIAMNLLSLAASFGILVWVFNEGHLGMQPSAVAIMIPVFIAGLVFGISMDYGVFMLSRIQEVYRQTGESDLAVQQGLASTGRLITSAAGILLSVTVPFAFAEVEGVRQLGIGITAAVLIDVTIIRLVLVPSLMKLMGRWNWWLPGRH